MLIACDVDGVLADMEAEWYRRYNAEYGDTLTADQVTGWDLAQFVRPECGQRIYDYLTQPDFYSAVGMYEGALAGVGLLRAAGCKVLFVTSCTYGMVDQKARWLERHGFASEGKGRMLPPGLVVTHDKAAIRADLLIDDGAHNVQAWLEHTSAPAILVDRPHNRSYVPPQAHAPRVLRRDNWRSIVVSVYHLLGRTLP